MSLEERFKFEEGSLVCTVKVDLSSYREEVWHDHTLEKHMLILAYFEDFKYDIIEFSSGIHKNGKAEKPHAHIHYVLKYTGTGNAIYSNESQRRTRWVNQATNDEQHTARVCGGLKPSQITFASVSMKYMPLDMNSIHYDVLAYPLKEGNRCTSMLYSMEPQYVTALEEYAMAIYKGQVAMHERREKNEEKTQCRKEAMLKCAKEYRHLYDNWMDMALILEKYYLSPLPFREKMKPQEFKINCQIIAQELQIASYVRDFF